MHFKCEVNTAVTFNSLQMIVKEDNYMDNNRIGLSSTLETIIKKAKQKKEQEKIIKEYVEASKNERIEAFIQKAREEKQEIPQKTAQELEMVRKAKLAEEAKAKKEAELASTIEKFEKDVYEKMYDKYRSNVFFVMSKLQIPEEIVCQFLCKKWDIVGEYLDLEGNFKYSFTKIMNAECGEFIMRPYINLYELEELEEEV